MTDCTRLAIAFFAASASFLGGAGVPAVAGPNLMAVGHLGEISYQRAEGRDSFSGGEVLYAFDEPALDFGRIVIRSNQPNSVVRRDLFVGYDGDGLIVDTRPRGGQGGALRIEELEIWLRIQGDVRPRRDYAWEIEVSAANESIEAGFPAVVPAMWADGESIGVEVLVRRPPPRDVDRIERLVIPNGTVRLPAFERQTGGAWVVLKPTRFGSYFQVHRVSFRELDTPDSIRTRTDMPVPMHYIPIRDVLENGITEALLRGGEALIAARNEDDHWPAEALEKSVELTARVVSALAEIGTDVDTLLPSMQWLASQEPEGEATPPYSIATIAARLYCLARHGGLKRFRRVIQADVQTLTHAQFDHGGWSMQTRGDDPATEVTANADNLSTALVLRSLREADFAGAVISARVWRDAMQYWTEARAYDGGFRERLELYGGYGTGPTSAYTSLGAAALLTSLDMASGVSGRRCNTYLASRNQLRTIDGALAWLNRRFQSPLDALTSEQSALDPYIEPQGLQWLGEVSGLVEFNKRNHFSESARELLRHFDRESGLFGVRATDDDWAEPPAIKHTALALSTLGAGAAPTICQRIILGGDENNWSQYKGDVPHLVRYIGDQRGRPFNWRRASIKQSVRELAKVPMLFLSVVGPFDWSQDQWGKIRDYCFGGGSVVIDVSEGQNAQREHILAALARTFPEYPLENLPVSTSIYSLESELSRPPVVQALGNGLRYFIFLPAESWSCQWHLYQIRENEATFALMNNLLTYTTDGTRLRDSFAAPTYPAGARPSYSMKALHLEVGGATPAHPDLVRTLDRLLRAHYRLAVVETADVVEADLVWVSITGDAPPSAQARTTLQAAIERGPYLFIDVATGDEGWDETFRGWLKNMEGITLARLRHTDPVYSGKIPGSQGFDVVSVPMRRALHTRFSRVGRCDLRGIHFNGKRTGVYSGHDISSGIGYELFPGCRGPMPAYARRIAMNACLTAYLSKVQRSSASEASVAP